MTCVIKINWLVHTEVLLYDVANVLISTYLGRYKPAKTEKLFSGLCHLKTISE